MSRSLECPRCRCHVESSGSGWQSRACPRCGAPLLLASVPAQKLVRRYLTSDRLAPMDALSPRGRRDLT